MFAQTSICIFPTISLNSSGKKKKKKAKPSLPLSLTTKLEDTHLWIPLLNEKQLLILGRDYTASWWFRRLFKLVFCQQDLNVGKKNIVQSIKSGKGNVGQEKGVFNSFFFFKLKRQFLEERVFCNKFSLTFGLSGIFPLRVLVNRASTTLGWPEPQSPWIEIGNSDFQLLALGWQSTPICAGGWS